MNQAEKAEAKIEKAKVSNVVAERKRINRLN